MVKPKKQEDFVINRPVKKWKAGNVEAAIWVNKREMDGGEVEFKTVSLTRSFKKRGDETWRSEVMHLRRMDITKIQLVLGEALKELMLNKEENE